MGKSDPFLEICRSLPDGNWQVVQKTEASYYLCIFS